MVQKKKKTETVCEISKDFSQFKAVQLWYQYLNILKAFADINWWSDVKELEVL